MDVYKTPESDVEIIQPRKFKPVKAILFGLLISVVVEFVVSIIEGVLATFFLRVDFSGEKKLTEILANSIGYLATDLVVMALIYYYAGTMVRKYAPGKELLFSLILSFATFAVYLPLALSEDTFSVYPTWYNLGTLLIMFYVIYLGAKPRGQK